jgi:hypothetical protein
MIIAAVVIIIATGAYLISRTRAKMESIQCANILSSIGVAARLYAQDNAGTYAPDVRIMSNEISTPKILVCPSDLAKVAALHFFEVCPSNTTYEYLVSGVKQDDKSTNAVFRCPIHRHVVCEDGRVIRGDGTIQIGKAFP